MNAKQDHRIGTCGGYYRVSEDARANTPEECGAGHTVATLHTASFHMNLLIQLLLDYCEYIQLS